MNQIVITGRLTKDIELSQTANGISVTRFNVAVPSEIKTADGERGTDFFMCVAWRNAAEDISKYFKKGSPIELFGSMNSRTYQSREKGIQQVWELNVKGWNFPPLNKEDGDQTKATKQTHNGTPELIPLDDDETDDLPF